MTPKEKAEDLLMKFSNPFAKSCALITVDEMLANADIIWGWDVPARDGFIKYWQEVKQEIEKL